MKSILFLIGITLSLNACDLFHKNGKTHESQFVVYDTSSTYNPFDPLSSGETWTGDGEILFDNYKPTKEKKWELKHTDLRVRFDFKQRKLLGEADILISPYAAQQDTLFLDAKNMDIESIWNLLPNGQMPEHAIGSNQIFYVDSSLLKIYLGSFVQPGETKNIRIFYTAKPYEIGKTGGNLAITDDRGLFFINHDLSDPSKPRQIWTQGETESNSHWFPTIDAPNQKMTQTIQMTVPDTMVTLSNGTLLKSIKNTEGTRTDFWEQKQPHAPYLTMMAVGNWEIIKDKWRNKEVNYLVEKKYAPFAKLNFGNTPEMMEFFSQYTGVDFAWDKYSQVVVRDFVSGAMENTSATVHMEGLQQTPDLWKDKSMEDYVSHELFHQWFGDLVTSESWSNITLNESFATYGEYLWRKHKYGQESADFILDDFRNNYNWLGFDEGKKLVRYDYGKVGELFDAVSYQKGALILHMLQYTIGEKSFRSGIKNYLQNHMFGNAEVADLRMAMENATGRDLNWFFDQWYFAKGHPKIQLVLQNEPGDKKQQLYIQQTQTNRNCFNFPVRIEWSENGQIKSKKLFITQRNTIVNLECDVKPDWFVFDADNTLLCTIEYSLTDIADIEKQVTLLHNAYQHTASQSLKNRLFEQAANLTEFSESDAVKKSFAPFLRESLKSTYPYILSRALQFKITNLNQDGWNDNITQDTIVALLNNKSIPSDCRAQAISALYYMKAPNHLILKYTTDSSVAVSYRAILMLNNDSLSNTQCLSYMRLESRSIVAQYWASELISSGKINKIEILENFLSNKNIELSNFSNVARIALGESNNEEDIQIIRYFYSQFQKTNQINLLKILAMNIRDEYTDLKRQLTNSDDQEDASLKAIKEKCKLYEEVIESSKK